MQPTALLTIQEALDRVDQNLWNNLHEQWITDEMPGNDSGRYMMEEKGRYHDWVSTDNAPQALADLHVNQEHREDWIDATIVDRHTGDIFDVRRKAVLVNITYEV